MSIGKKKAQDLLYTLIKVREVEERIAELYPQDEIKCPVHLSTGSEAVSVGVCATLKKKDYVVGGHRGHGIYLAKGGDLNAFFAELYGKKTGCCGGKGGSMHLSAPEVGLVGTTPILASTIPIGVGLALSSKIKKEDKITAIFFGDGSTEEGVFYESLNLAALKKLPVIFVCENNRYSIFQKQTARQPLDNIFEKGKAFDIPGVQVDGNNLVEVVKAAEKAVKKVLEGKGPYIIEGVTNRWRQHVGCYYDYELGYSSKEDLDSIMEFEDPVKMFFDWGARKSYFDAGLMQKIKKDVEKEIDVALKFAQESPSPEPEDLYSNLY